MCMVMYGHDMPHGAAMEMMMGQIVTKSQYDALMEIADRGERLKACDLNIRPQTWNALVMRGWVEVKDGHAFVTGVAWDAMK